MYKISYELNDFEDRNVVNHNIHFFTDASKALKKLSKIVFQNAVLAKEISASLLEHKKMSSFPIIIDMLKEADKVALDSPWKFSSLCLSASDELSLKINKLKQEREEFLNEGIAKKGWR